MKCSRGKFAKLSNVKIDTLRYYEECGLIKIDYNEESKCYEYTDKEIFNLFIIREMRAIGFNIDEVKKSFEKPSGNLENQLAYLDEKIEYYQALRERIKVMDILLKRTSMEDIREFKRQKTYFFSFEKAAEYNISKDEAAQWLDAVPFAWVNITFKCDLIDYVEEYVPIDISLGIPASYANQYVERLDAPYVSVGEEINVVNFNVKTKHVDKIGIHEFDRLLEYVKEHGYKLNGNFAGIFKNCECLENGEMEYLFGIIAEIEK